MRRNTSFVLALVLGLTGVSGCGLTLEPSASASLSGDRTTSVRISRTAPRPVAEVTDEDRANTR